MGILSKLRGCILWRCRGTWRIQIFLVRCERGCILRVHLCRLLLRWVTCCVRSSDLMIVLCCKNATNPGEKFVKHTRIGLYIAWIIYFVVIDHIYLPKNTVSALNLLSCLNTLCCRFERSTWLTNCFISIFLMLMNGWIRVCNGWDSSHAGPYMGFAHRLRLYWPQTFLLYLHTCIVVWLLLGNKGLVLLSQLLVVQNNISRSYTIFVFHSCNETLTFSHHNLIIWCSTSLRCPSMMHK